MSEPTAPVSVTPGALRERLGKHALGASRDVRAAAKLAAGEELRAVVVSMSQRRGWVVVATVAGLRLARRPWLTRGRARSFEWRELTAVRSGPSRVLLTFGADELSLAAAGPQHEFARLLETVRAHVAGPGKPSVEEIRELARKKLGRLMTFGLEAAIEGLPDRLEPGERVERLAGAKHDFAGLLVLTDCRLLLLDITLRRADERLWDVARAGIRGAEPIEGGLRLQLAEREEVTLTEFLPPERRDEFAAVLYGGAGP